MILRSAQRGDGKAGCIFWVALLAIFSYIAYQVVPVKVDISDFEEFMIRQAETAGSSSAEQIERAILARAQDLDLPVSSKNLIVEKSSTRVIITCEYEIPISFIVYTYRWKIQHKIDRPVFLV